MMFGKNTGAEATASRIPAGSIGVEIGVWKGDSSALFLERAAHLHLVDPWSVAAYEDSDEFGDYGAYLARYSKIVGSSDPAAFQSYYDSVRDTVRRRFAGRPVTLHCCASAQFFASFAELVDWVYVDGAHSFDGCLEDLRGACKIVKVGGAIFGDDYGNKDGVTRAVQAFLMESGKTVEIFGRNQYQIRL